MYNFETELKFEGAIAESYNDILLTEIIDFKNNYEKQIEKYLNKIYSTNKDFNLFLDEMYRDLYEADKIMLDWYFNEGEIIFEKLGQDILLSDIEEKLYIQINNIIKGLTKIFNILWERNKEDRMDDIYKWIMDVPYLLLNKIEQVGVEKRMQENIEISIEYNQNDYEEFDFPIEENTILAA